MEYIRLHIPTPASAAALFFAALPKDQREERVFVLPLDGNGRPLAKPILVSAGHEDGTFACREAIRLAERAKRESRIAVARARAQIDSGAIFREALKAGAEEIIVAHDHPSGDITPSKADIAVTKKLREAGELLSVPLLDHLIIGRGTDGKPAFCSLAEVSS